MFLKIDPTRGLSQTSEIKNSHTFIYILSSNNLLTLLE